MNKQLLLVEVVDLQVQNSTFKLQLHLVQGHRQIPDCCPGSSLYQLTQGTAGIVLPAGRYDRSTLANLITRRFTQVGISDEKNTGGTSQVYQPDTLLFQNTEQESMADSIYREILTDDAPSGTGVTFDQTNSYTYQGSDPATPTDTINVTIGARKFKIEYGAIGAAYQVSDAHQSVNNPNDTKDNIAFFKTGQDQFLTQLSSMK